MTTLTEKLIAGAIAWTSCFGSEINSLQTGQAVLSSVQIDNATNLDMFMDVSFSFGSITPTGMPYFGLYFYPLNQDGSTYGDGRFGSAATAVPPQNYYLGFAGVNPAAGVQTGEFNMPGRRSPIILPPGAGKLVLYNSANVTMAASANTVKYRTYNRQIS